MPVLRQPPARTCREEAQCVDDVRHHFHDRRHHVPDERFSKLGLSEGCNHGVLDSDPHTAATGPWQKRPQDEVDEEQQGVGVGWDPRHAHATQGLEE